CTVNERLGPLPSEAFGYVIEPNPFKIFTNFLPAFGEQRRMADDFAYEPHVALMFAKVDSTVIPNEIGRAQREEGNFIGQVAIELREDVGFHAWPRSIVCRWLRTKAVSGRNRSGRSI